ncbi:hypothetical protein [Streptomyces sp. NPDC056255]|uniref:hypothetical protein n=1 Tax=Streptomyces sp. NPDC056255 TaxID=3345764 RepID=UPI0035D66F94
MGSLDGQDGIVGMIDQLWAAEEMPFHGGLHRPDDTGREVYVDGPGASRASPALPARGRNRLVPFPGTRTPLNRAAAPAR